MKYDMELVCDCDPNCALERARVLGKLGWKIVSIYVYDGIHHIWMHKEIWP